MIVHKGYKTKELIGKDQADSWKLQLHTNQSIIKVLNQNKLHEEVEEILQQQKLTKAKEESKDDENNKGGSQANDDSVSQQNKLDTSAQNNSDNESGFGEIELVDDIPNIIKP